MDFIIDSGVYFFSLINLESFFSNKQKRMALRVPITTEYFFDNFCDTFLGFSGPSSNIIEGPHLVLPHNVSEEFQPNANVSYTYQNNPPELRFDVTGVLTGIVQLIKYDFHYPVNMSHMLNNYNSIGNCFYIFVRNNFTGLDIALDLRLTIKTENYTNGTTGNFVATTTFQTIFAGTKAVLFFMNTAFFGTPDFNNVTQVLLELINYSPAASVSFSIMYLGYTRYPVIGDFSNLRLLLFDNFTLPQIITSSGTSTVTSDGSFYYEHSSPSANRQRILTHSSSSSGSIRIFQNFSTTVLNSPAIAEISGTFTNTTDFFSITYPNLNNLTPEDRGTLIYKLESISGSPTPIIKIEIVLRQGSTEVVLASREESPSSSNIKLRNVNFSNNSSTSYSNYDVVIRVSPNSGSTFPVNFRIRILHFSIVDDLNILPDPSPTFNYFSDTFTYVLTGNILPPTGIPFNPIGVLPSVGVTKTYLSTPPPSTNSEDIRSHVLNDLSPLNNTITDIIEYNFSPTADFSPLRNFYILFAVTGIISQNFSLTFRITVVDSSSNSIDFTGTVPSSDITADVVTKKVLSPTSILNLDSILKSVSGIFVRISPVNADPSNSLRIFSIKGKYSNRYIVFYDNFTFKQQDATTEDIRDRSLSYPGHPQRTLKSSTSTITTCYDMVGVNYNTKTERDKHLRIQFTSTSSSTGKIFYTQKNLLADYKYNILIHLLHPAGFNIANPSITIRDETKGIILHSQNISFTSGQSIIFIDPDVSEDISFELSGSRVGSIPAEMIVGSIFFEAVEATCVLEGSRILMADGSLKEVQNIQRGDLVLTAHGPLPVSRLIEEKLRERVYLIKIPKGCIDNIIPYSDLYVCSGHVIRHLGARRYASTLSCYKGVETLRGKRETITDKKAMYDLQFDIETFYYVEGLESQSRSPYCHYSPLPKELYYNKELYKNIRVSNALMDEREDINNNWPNINKKFCWRTYLAKYIIETQDQSITPKDFNEETALRLSEKKHIDLPEIIPEDFDWKKYIKLNDDLYERLRKTEMDACVHWVKYGYREKRRYK
jgi:hypothetical protein